MKHLFCGLMALGMLVGLTGDTKAQPSYSFTTLDPPGSTYTEAYGINNSGQIVGKYVDAGGQHGFLFDQGSYTTLDVPGAASTSASGINDSGQIVGSYGDAVSSHGFLFDQGSYTTLDVPGSTYTEAYGINNSGQVVGYYLVSATYPAHGFLFDQGNYTMLDVPGPFSTAANGINASGQIVGYYCDADCDVGDIHHSGPVHGFLLDQGSYNTFDVPGAISTPTSGINDSGQIVGAGITSIGPTYGDGFLLDNGNYATLDVPGAFWTPTYGINDSGQIVGSYGYGAGQHGFLATPVP
jgi:probable HAF family extracellular repeat protein